MKKVQISQKALSLRKRGYSLREISEKLDIAKSTASLWLKGIRLSKKAKTRIRKVKIRGNESAGRTNHKKKIERLRLAGQQACKNFSRLNLNKKHFRLICSLIYWCEGAKEDSTLKFSNSDPELVKTFLCLLRRSFQINEKKFRPIIHLHKYHDAKKQLCFWSKTMKIPEEQFMHSYIKPNEQKRIHPNYQGCVNVTYYDASLARELLAIAKIFFKKYGDIC
jgi:hypothetical protein